MSFRAFAIPQFEVIPFSVRAFNVDRSRSARSLALLLVVGGPNAKPRVFANDGLLLVAFAGNAFLAFLAATRTFHGFSRIVEPAIGYPAAYPDKVPESPIGSPLRTPIGYPAAE